MKNKLIAMLLTGTLLGGIGAGTYLTVGQGEKSEAAQIQTIKVCNGKIVQSNNKYNCISLNNEIIKSLLNEKSNNTKSKESNNSKNIDSKSKNSTSEAKKKSNDKKTNVKANENKASNNKNSSKSNSTSKKNNNVSKSSNTSKDTVSKNNTSKSNISTSNTGQASVASEKFMAQVEQKIFEKVNAERAKAGVSKLSYNKTMEKYARIKSQDMGDRGYFDHKDPQGNLITVKMKNDGVNYKAWGENIAYIGGVSDADALANQFMTNWMNSQGHRENILSKNFSSIGVGVYKMGNKVYATQEFYK